MLHYLRALLYPADAGARPAQRKPQILRRYNQLEGIALFEEIVCATHLAALQTVAVASCVNALHSRHRPVHPLMMRNFVPRMPDVMRRLERCADEMALTGPTVQAVGEFMSQAASIENVIQTFSIDAERLGTTQALALHLEQLSTATRQLCGAALAAMQSLAQPVQRYLLSRYDGNMAEIERLLARVIVDESPCLDAHGDVCLPELPQRRPWPRRYIRRPCVVEHDSKRSGAVIQDISVDGMGLVFASGLLPKEAATVDIAGERLLQGVVVWTKGSHAGIRFNTPLRPNDPLLHH
jgi:hypothetical protein